MHVDFKRLIHPFKPEQFIRIRNRSPSYIFQCIRIHSIEFQNIYRIMQSDRANHALILFLYAISPLTLRAALSSTNIAQNLILPFIYHVVGSRQRADAVDCCFSLLFP